MNFVILPKRAGAGGEWGGGGSYGGAGCGDGSKSQLPWLAWESQGEQLSSRGVTRLRLNDKYHFFPLQFKITGVLNHT